MTRPNMLGFLLAALLAAGGPAAAQTVPVKLTLDWKFQGPTAFILLAADNGYYKAEGLDVTIDAGQGSAGAVNRVASGAYELGFADINSLIEYNAANPDKQIKSVMMVYDAAPFGVYALKGSGIAKPADLNGRVLGAPVFDASYKLFPTFAKANGVDDAKVVRKNMDPALREAMLVRKEVDFISGHYLSSFLDLTSKGVKPEDIVVMMYSDFGMDFYGNGMIASPKMVAERPELLKGFVRATMKGLQDMLKNPASAIAAVVKRDPLVDTAIETERLKIAVTQNIVTANTRKNGMGDVDPVRLGRSIDQVAASVTMPRKPAPADIFTNAFLPAREARSVE